MMQVELSLFVLIPISGHFDLVLFLLYRNKCVYVHFAAICVYIWSFGMAKQAR